MTEESFIQRVAKELGVRIVAPLKGGEFGAFLVIDRDNRELVLKALPIPQFAADWAQGAAMAEVLRQAGYPSPHYLGTGALTDACWSLQEKLPGEVPPSLTASHAEQLVALCRRHRDAAGARGDLLSHVIDVMTIAVRTMRSRPESARLADELAALLERSSHLALGSSDIVHYDFHSQNYLAIGDDVTGVFDWEGARPGDWRCDLANLVVTTTDPHSIGALEAEPREIAALFIGWHCARYLAFDITNHPPDRIAQMAPLVEERLSFWWRRTA